MPSFRPPRSFQLTIPHCCSQTLAWCSLRTCSSTPEPARTAAQRTRRRACASPANTTTWMMWAGMIPITLSLRCSATGPLATITSKMQSRGRGSCSPGYGACPKTACGPPASAMNKALCRKMTKPHSAGCSSRGLIRSTCSSSGARTIFGRWPKSAHAGQTLKFILTAAPSSAIAQPCPAKPAASTPAAPAIWNYGTWCSSSTTATAQPASSRCPPSTLIPAWASSALSPCCKMSTPTIALTCSRPSCSAFKR